MDEDIKVSLPELFRRVPQLLESCKGDDDRDAALLQLRLINREASQVALLGLKTYYLDLRGDRSDTNVAGATLLQSTRLHTFKVYLQLSAMFDPTTKLKEFLQIVGAALSTVNTMDLYLVDSGAAPRRSARLAEAMVLMASACPCLKILISQGPVPTSFLQQLGQTSPHLSKMSINAEPEDITTVHRIFDLLPTLIPQISSLVFPYMGGPGCKLPDMSGRPGIVSLDISSFTFSNLNSWRRLPPNLQYLKCCKILKMPVASLGNSKIILGSLLTLGTRVAVMFLEGFINLLQAAPLLQEFSTPGDENFSIDCPLDSPSVASDFAALHQRMQAGLRMKGIMRVYGSSEEEVDGSSHAPLISRLTRMPLINRCTFKGLDPAELRCLMGMFPSIEDMVLECPRDLGDAGLLEVARCVRLSRLLLEFCPRVSPQGLSVLCQRLPGLESIRCGGCLQLTKHALANCALNLEQTFGLRVQLVELT